MPRGATTPAAATGGPARANQRPSGARALAAPVREFVQILRQDAADKAAADHAKALADAQKAAETQLETKVAARLKALGHEPVQQNPAVKGDDAPVFSNLDEATEAYANETDPDRREKIYGYISKHWPGNN